MKYCSHQFCLEITILPNFFVKVLYSCLNKREAGRNECCCKGNSSAQSLKYRYFYEIHVKHKLGNAMTVYIDLFDMLLTNEGN